MVDGVTPNRGVNMGSRTTRAITVRVSNDAAIALELEASRNGKSVKEVIENIGLDIRDGRLELCGDSLMPIGEYMTDISLDSEYDKLNFGVVKDAYERCGYPTHVIRRNNEVIASQIRDGGKFNGRKFSDDPC